MDIREEVTEDMDGSSNSDTDCSIFSEAEGDADSDTDCSAFSEVDDPGLFADNSSIADDEYDRRDRGNRLEAYRLSHHP